MAAAAVVMPAVTAAVMPAVPTVVMATTSAVPANAQRERPAIAVAVPAVVRIRIGRGVVVARVGRRITIGAFIVATRRVTVVVNDSGVSVVRVVTPAEHQQRTTRERNSSQTIHTRFHDASPESTANMLLRDR